MGRMRFTAVLFFSAAAFAQHPDFTGTWKEAGLPERLTIERIEHRDPDLRVAFQSREEPVRPTTLQRPLASMSGSNEYSVDGVEHADMSPSGRQRWRTVGWQGPELVFLTVARDGYKVTVTREAWALSDGGHTLTKYTRVVNMDGVAERTAVFERQ
jgi:hypothetical protein